MEKQTYAHHTFPHDSFPKCDLFTPPSLYPTISMLPVLTSVAHKHLRNIFSLFEYQNSLILSPSPSTSLCVSIRILGFNSKQDPGDRVHVSGRSSKGSYACVCGLSVTKTPMLHKIIPIIFCLYPSPELPLLPDTTKNMFYGTTTQVPSFVSISSRHHPS